MTEEKKPTPTKPKETQRGGRKVGKTSNQNKQSGPRGGRKIGKNEQAQGPRGGRKVGKTSDSEELAPYKPRHLPLQAADLDQHAAESERQAELDAAREEHNRRTGDASLR